VSGKILRMVIATYGGVPTSHADRARDIVLRWENRIQGKAVNGI
jgi:hypothetical protein